MTRLTPARHFAGACLIGCASLALAGTATAQTTIKMAMSSVADQQNDNGMTAWVMQNYVNSHSDSLTFEVYGSSALGGDQDVLQAMQLGSGATMHVGGTAVYLVSDAGACTTGEIIHVDGGFHVLGMPQYEYL